MYNDDILQRILSCDISDENELQNAFLKELLMDNNCQLSKADILSLPNGIWKGFIGLYKILEGQPPQAYFVADWSVEVDSLPPNNKYLKVGRNVNWVPYDVRQNCTETGDLVFEDYLMRMYNFQKNYVPTFVDGPKLNKVKINV